MNQNRIKKNNEIRKSPAYKKQLAAMLDRIRLAAELSEARNTKGWSQQELAFKASTTQKVVSRIESGDMNPGFDLSQRIFKALDLGVRIGSTIFSGTPEDRVYVQLHTDSVSFYGPGKAGEKASNETNASVKSQFIEK